jgi:hypothetical protein
MVTRVNGGVLSSQALKGKLRFFKLVGPTNCFQYSVGTDDVGDGSGDPEVIIPQTTSAPNSYSEKVGVGMPVPNSVADRMIRAISDKCTISAIRIVSGTTIHICIEGDNNGWDTTSEGPYNFTTGLDTNSDAATNIAAAIAALGTVLLVPTTVDAGKSFAFDTVGDGSGTSVIAITETPFILA